jgi:MoxR-like ATPase
LTGTAELPALDRLDDAELADRLKDAGARIATELRKVIVGNDDIVEQSLIALFAGGNCLLVGVPGLAKTLLISTMSRALDLKFARIQFTPDLMPSDVTGTDVIQDDPATGQRRLSFMAGPVFCNVLLADEINRTPPKTQAALLESMEERQVTVEGETHPLPDPFIVIATQNPVEYEGTYPLPEAQLDRFLFKLLVPYPTAEQEQAILARHDAGLDPHDVRGAGVRAVAGVTELEAGRRQVGAVRCDPAVLGYVVALARATREAPSLALGVSPRGATMLLHAAKAWTWLSGGAFVTPDAVKAMARPTFRHRIQLRPEVELEGGTPDGVLEGILTTVPVPR